jgi:flavin-dependent dehydrogenase
MERWDVVVVGASAAGLYAAEQLARAGRQVEIFERWETLAPARRTYIITSQLRQLMGEIPCQAVLNHIRTIEIATPGACARVELGDPDLIVERSVLAHYLAEQARGAGARLHFGHRFRGLDAQAGQAILTLGTADGQTVQGTARAIIGADGVFSDVAQAAGLQPPPFVPIVQAEVALPQGWNPSVTKVWFDVNATRYFYWLIPESEERAVVGLVGEKPSETRALLDRFLERQGFTPLAYQAAQVAMHHPRLRPWGRIGTTPVLLVGDAAGQVKVTTVGGTVSGLWGAQAAVRALTARSRPQSELRALKRELDLHWIIRLLLERLDNAGYDRLARNITPPLQRFLNRHNRDKMAGHFWQVPLIQPQLLALGLSMLGRRSRHDQHVSGEASPVAEVE